MNRRGRAIHRTLTAATAVWLAISASAEAARLTPEALEAFSRYVALTETRIDSELTGGRGFLWIDSLSEARRQSVTRRLRRGDVVIESLEMRDDGKRIKVPGGLIQHWVALVFIPGVGVQQMLATIQDYNRYPQFYAYVRRARIVEHDDNHFMLSMRTLKKKIVTVVLDVDTEADFFAVDATHVHARGRTTRIAEVKHHDTPDEYERPIGDDGGFLWRLNTYSRYEERDGGTYLQFESISLSRDIPATLAWLISPIVRKFARDALAEGLMATRAAVLREHAAGHAQPHSR